MLTSLMLVLLLVPTDPPAWPGFLGAGASAIDPASIPLSWAPGKNVAWDASLPGHGQSSPVIWNDRAFVTTVEGENKETCHTLCLSLADGSILWDHKHTSTAPDPNSVYISRGMHAGCRQSSRLRFLRMRGPDCAHARWQGRLDKVPVSALREVRQQIRAQRITGADR